MILDWKSCDQSTQVSFFVLPEILCMSEIGVSINAALSELHLGLALHWFSHKACFRSALCVARCGQKKVKIRL